MATATKPTDLDNASDLIAGELADGEWHSSNEIHEKFAGEIPEGMFGRVKSALGIEHRSLFQWRLPSGGSAGTVGRVRPRREIEADVGELLAELGRREVETLAHFYRLGYPFSLEVARYCDEVLDPRGRGALLGRVREAAREVSAS